jgi:YbbR domain-containing protein
MAKKFLKTLTNNIGFKILAVVMASVLWLVVYNIDDPTQTKTYTTRVTIENENAISKMSKYYEVLDGTNSVSFTVSAKRSILNKIEDSDFTATADMSTVVLSDDGLTGTVELKISCSRNESSLKYNGKSKYLRISLEDLMTKQLVISANSSGTVADGYALGEVSITGSNVLKVSGPASVVGEVATAVATINVDGVATNLSDTVVPTLYNEQGEEIDTTKLTMNMTTVTINAVVLGTKEFPVVFSSQGTPGDGYQVVEITSDPGTIRLKGTAAALNGAVSIEIPAELLDVTDMTENLTTTIDISDYLPDGCEPLNKSQTVLTVTVWMERYIAKSFTVPVSSIAVEGLDSERNMSYTGTTVDVTLGGLSSRLNALNTSSIRLVMNVSGLAVGSHTVDLSFEEGNEELEGLDLLNAQAEIFLEDESTVPENENNGGNSIEPNGGNGDNSIEPNGGNGDNSLEQNGDGGDNTAEADN